MDRSAVRDWSLSFQDLTFLSTLPPSVCFEAALQICSARGAGQFIEDWFSLDNETIKYVASQLGVQATRPDRFFSSRTARRYRLGVARHLHLTRPQAHHRADLEEWLRVKVCPRGGSVNEMLGQSFQWFREQQLLPPTEDVLARFIRTARKKFLDDLLKRAAETLSPNALEALEICLTEPRGRCGFQHIKDGIGAATLDNVLDTADRVSFIQVLDLPFDFISCTDPYWLKILMRRVDAATASEMRRYNQKKRLGLLAIYLVLRRSQLVDGLVDLLIEVVHRIHTRSRRKVIGKIASDIGLTGGSLKKTAKFG